MDDIDCELIDTEIVPGWMIMESDGKIWLENQHCFTAFELDKSRVKESAMEILREVGA